MDNLREIVNGGQLPMHVNGKVSITGFVTQTSSSGLSFELRAVDNVIVQINLKKPLGRSLDGYVEVHGTCQGKSVVADNIISFNNTEFDAQSHNTLCSLLQSIPNVWKTRANAA